MWQEMIVAVIVAAALLHFSTKYLPVSWRRRIVYTLGKRGFNEVKLAKFFKTQGGGCGDSGDDGGCSSCGSCGTTPTKDNSATQHRVIKLHVQR